MPNLNNPASDRLWSLLCQAIQQGRPLEKIKIILQSINNLLDISTSEQDSLGSLLQGCTTKIPTPLHLAVIRNDLTILKELKSHVAAPLSTILDNDRTNLLMAAAKYGAQEAMEYLVSEEKFGLEVKDNHGYTALHHTINGKMPEEKQIKTIQFLLDQGANIEAQDSKGNTALLVAAANKNLAVLTYLVENKADLFATNQANADVLELCSDDPDCQTFIYKKLQAHPNKAAVRTLLKKHFERQSKAIITNFRPPERLEKLKKLYEISCDILEVKQLDFIADSAVLFNYVDTKLEQAKKSSTPDDTKRAPLESKEAFDSETQETISWLLRIGAPVHHSEDKKRDIFQCILNDSEIWGDAEITAWTRPQRSIAAAIKSVRESVRKLQCEITQVLIQNKINLNWSNCIDRILMQCILQWKRQGGGTGYLGGSFNNYIGHWPFPGAEQLVEVMLANNITINFADKIWADVVERWSFLPMLEDDYNEKGATSLFRLNVLLDKNPKLLEEQATNNRLLELLLIAKDTNWFKQLCAIRKTKLLCQRETHYIFNTILENLSKNYYATAEDNNSVTYCPSSSYVKGMRVMLSNLLAAGEIFDDKVFQFAPTYHMASSYPRLQEDIKTEFNNAIKTRNQELARQRNQTKTELLNCIRSKKSYGSSITHFGGKSPFEAYFDYIGKREKEGGNQDDIRLRVMGKDQLLQALYAENFDKACHIIHTLIQLNSFSWNKRHQHALENLIWPNGIKPTAKDPYKQLKMEIDALKKNWQRMTWNPKFYSYFLKEEAKVDMPIEISKIMQEYQGVLFNKPTSVRTLEEQEQQPAPVSLPRV